jgi:hypothetical protein
MTEKLHTKVTTKSQEITRQKILKITKNKNGKRIGHFIKT